MNPVQTKNTLQDYSLYLSSLGLSQLSIKNYRSDIKSFLSSLSHMPTSQITSSTISSYTLFLQGTLKPQIYKRKCTALHHFSRFLHIEPKSSFSSSISLPNFSFSFFSFAFFIIGVVLTVSSLRSATSARIPSAYISVVPSEILAASPKTVSHGVVTLTSADAPDVDQDVLVELLRTTPTFADEQPEIFSEGRCDFIYKHIKLDSLFQKSY
jgi:hypothetical protein